MIFAKFNENMYTKNKYFISDNSYCSLHLRTILKNGYITPGTNSSLGENLRLSIIKAISEMQERDYIAFNYFKDELEVINAINIIDGKINSFGREVLGYGETKLGWLDTTGSASGVGDLELVYKAVAELIEKNELLLFWYGNKGYRYMNLRLINTIKNKFGFESNELLVFGCNELSNLKTIIVCIFDSNKRLIGSGVASRKTEELAFIEAFRESILLKWAYSPCGQRSPYSDNSQEIYNYLVNREDSDSQDLKVYTYKKTVIEGIEIVDWIDNIFISILNSQPYQKSMAIKVFSSNLVNSIPLKSNLLKSKNNSIIKQYNILEHMDVIDCRIV